MKPRYVCTATTEKREIRFYVAAPTMKKALAIAETDAKSILRVDSMDKIDKLKLDERTPEGEEPEHSGQTAVKGTSPKELNQPGPGQA